MSGHEHRAQVRAQAGGSISVLLGIGLVLGFAPLARILSPRPWLLASLCAVVLVLGAGYLIRKLWGRTALTVVVQLALVIVVVTVGYAAPTSLFGVVPTFETATFWVNSLTAAVQEIRVGVAPLEGTEAVGVLLTSAIGVLTIALDLVTVRLRWTLVAALVVLAIVLVPGIYMPSDGDVLTVLVALVVAVALLLAAHPSRAEDRPRRAGAAIAVAVPAVLVAMVAAPLVPMAPAGAGGGFGATASLDASIDLGRDLRNPRETPVLRFRSTAQNAPYLRLATMSHFDGGVWLPDEDESPEGLSWLADQRPLLAGDPNDDRTGSIEMLSVSTSLLPVPPGLTGLDGLNGIWTVNPDGRTVSSPSSSASGQAYSMTFSEPDPTTQQLRAASGSTRVPPNTLNLPDDVPPVIAEEMERVTAGEDTPFDKLMALQSWFRSSEFTYSLDAPVEDGYDRAGLDAMTAFLEKKAGYCVHFASTFAVMAREMGMPSRVVLGFLPGSSTNDTVDGQRVFEVTSGQLHTWPEVYFGSAGWVAFEPTASLGAPSTFRTAADANNPTPAPTASTAPSPSSSRDVQDPAAREDTGGGSTAGALRVDFRVPLVVLCVLLVLAAPALIRRWLLLRRVRRIDNGDALAAWEELLATATDLGIPVRERDSPRQIAASLAERGVDLSPIVAAVEHQSYSRNGVIPRGPALIPIVYDFRDTWKRSASGFARVQAALLPRSLMRRPVLTTRPGDASGAEWSRAPARTR